MVKRVVFWLVLLVGLFVTAEAMLRLLSASSRSVEALLSVEPVRAAIRDRELGWRGNPDYPEHDRLGFRNPAPPVDATLVALGDSQTYGSRVRPDEAWPRQLEQLGVTPSYNMAFPGWGPPQALLVLDEALALGPELVVVGIYTGNDLVDAFTFVYESDRLRQLRLTDPRARAVFEAAEAAHPFDGDLLEHQDDDGLGRRARARQRPDSAKELAEQHSRLYGLGLALGRIVGQAQRGRQAPAGPDEAEGELSLSANGFQTILTPGYRQQAVELSDPRIDEGLRLTVATLAEMDRQSVASGARLAVLLIPTKELALAEVARPRLAGQSPLYAELLDDETTVREALLERLAAAQIRVLDALPALQQDVRDGVLPYSSTDDGHLNARGQRTVAALVSAAVGQ